MDKTAKCHPVWVDNKNKIISFKEEEQFEQIFFESYEELMAFTVKQCSMGYRIQ